jgi:hypothetical protein
MAESTLKEVIARLRAATEERDWGLEYGLCTVRAHDIGVLFETIKRYGGRHDWTPTPQNIERLPGPVRRYIASLQIEIGQRIQALIRADAERRRLEALVAELRHPPR